MSSQPETTSPDAFLEHLESEETSREVEVVDDDIGQGERHRTRLLIKNIHESYWELAENFGRIMDQKLYKKWGYTSFEDYLEKECDMKKAKGYALAKIFNHFTKDLAPKFSDEPQLYAQVIETAKEIGWAKASKLATAKLISPENADFICTQAKTLSSEQLDMAIKTSLRPDKPKELTAAGEEMDSNGTTRNTMKTVRKAFQFDLRQADSVDTAIKKALTDMKPGAKDESALALICDRFVASEITSLESLLCSIEEQFGIAIVSFAQDYSEITYGAGTLDEYSEHQRVDTEEQGA